jgi:hypothetical protein
MATKYWIAAIAADSDDNAQWSTSSGGANDTTAPTSGDDVILDGNGLGNCNWKTATVSSVTMSAGYTSTLTPVLASADFGDFVINDGVFASSALALTMDTFTQGGGTFNSTSATLSLKTFPSTFVYTAGTFNHNNGVVKADGTDSEWDAPGITFYDLTIDHGNAAATAALLSDLDIENDLYQERSGLSASGGTRTVTVRGDMRFGVQGSTTVADTLFVLEGTGAQAVTVDSPLDTHRLHGGFEINKVSGTVTVDGVIRVQNGNGVEAWTLTAGAASMGTSTIIFAGFNHVFDDGTTDFYNITFDHSNPATGVTFNSNMKVTNILDLDGIGAMNGNKIFVGGDLIIQNTTGTGTTQIEFNGTADQDITASDTWSYDAITVNKASGTLIFSTNLTMSGASKDFTQTAGLINLGGFDLTVTGDMTLDGGFADLVGSTLAIGGDFNAVDGALSGTAAWFLNVSGSISRADNCTIAYCDASGGIQLVATASTNVTPLDNINIFFLAAIKYWISGGAGSASDDSLWSTISGGPNNTISPGSDDGVVFDGNGLGNCDMDIASCNFIDIDSGYTGTITQSKSFSVSTTFEQEGGAGSFWLTNGWDLDTPADIVIGANSGFTMASGSTATVLGNWDTQGSSDVDLQSGSILRLAGDLIIPVGSHDYDGTVIGGYGGTTWTFTNTDNSHDIDKIEMADGSNMIQSGNCYVDHLEGPAGGMATISGSGQFLINLYTNGEYVTVNGTTDGSVDFTFGAGGSTIIPAYNYGNAGVAQSSASQFTIEGGIGSFSCYQLSVFRSSQNITTLIDVNGSINFHADDIQIGGTGVLTRGGLFRWNSTGTFTCGTMDIQENNGVVTTAFEALNGCSDMEFSSDVQLDTTGRLQLDAGCGTMTILGTYNQDSLCTRNIAAGTLMRFGSDVTIAANNLGTSAGDCIFGYGSTQVSPIAFDLSIPDGDGRWENQTFTEYSVCTLTGSLRSVDIVLEEGVQVTDSGGNRTWFVTNYTADDTAIVTGTATDRIQFQCSATTPGTINLDNNEYVVAGVLATMSGGTITCNSMDIHQTSNTQSQMTVPSGSEIICADEIQMGTGINITRCGILTVDGGKVTADILSVFADDGLGTYINKLEITATGGTLISKNDFTLASGNEMELLGGRFELEKDFTLAAGALATISGANTLAFTQGVAQVVTLNTATVRCVNVEKSAGTVTFADLLDCTEINPAAINGNQTVELDNTSAHSIPIIRCSGTPGNQTFFQSDSAGVQVTINNAASGSPTQYYATFKDTNFTSQCIVVDTNTGANAGNNVLC